MSCQFFWSVACVLCLSVVSHAHAQSVLGEGELGVEVSCSEPVDGDYAYRATAHGTLRATGEPGTNVTLIVAGDVELHLTADGWGARTKTVHARGELYRDGSSAYGHVSAPSDDVEAVYLNLPDGDHSAVLAFDPNPASHISRSYAMNCSATRVKLPHVVDLVVTNDLWDAFGIALSSSRAYLSVRNIGDAPLRARNLRVRIGSFEGRAESVLDAYTAEFDVINPGNVGSVALPLPRGSLSSCTAYDVAVDIDGAVQTHYYDELSNDTGSSNTACLDWTTTIDVFTFSDREPGDLSIVEDKTIEQIVSNQVSGREDGKICRDCHTPASGRRYLPPAGIISPTQIIEGRSWAQAGGWADIIQDVSIKPAHLKRLFAQWKRDGAR